MSASITLRVVGVPAPQGSKSAFVCGGRAVVVDGSSATGRAGHTAWRQAVATAARDWLGDNPQSPLAEPVALVMHFSFPQVASAPDRFWHVTTPDLDKLIRSTQDALVSAGLLADDRYVCQLVVDKAYCAHGRTAGCEVRVFPMGYDEAAKSADRKARRKERRKAERDLLADDAQEGAA